MIKRQLYSARGLREAASLNLSCGTDGKDQLDVALTSLYSAHSCTKHRPRLLPSGSPTHANGTAAESERDIATLARLL